MSNGRSAVELQSNSSRTTVESQSHCSCNQRFTSLKCRNEGSPACVVHDLGGGVADLFTQYSLMLLHDYNKNIIT